MLSGEFLRAEVAALLWGCKLASQSTEEAQTEGSSRHSTP